MIIETCAANFLQSFGEMPSRRIEAGFAGVRDAKRLAEIKLTVSRERSRRAPSKR